MEKSECFLARQPGNMNSQQFTAAQWSGPPMAVKQLALLVHPDKTQHPRVSALKSVRRCFQCFDPNWWAHRIASELLVSFGACFLIELVLTKSPAKWTSQKCLRNRMGNQRSACWSGANRFKRIKRMIGDWNACDGYTQTASVGPKLQIHLQKVMWPPSCETFGMRSLQEIPNKVVSHPRP